MKPFSNINYEACENRFALCEHVKSRLIYGDAEKIPNPWLTVVIPTYRRVDQLKQALDSLLTQHHAYFVWDILVVDNEPDDGIENDTERYIRKLDNDRIMLYRNSENIWVGDNFNRCFTLARGKWVTMLHDDDFLIANTLQTIGKLIEAYDTEDKPLGAIAASYIQVEYDPVHNEIRADVPGINDYLCSQPTNYYLYQLTHNNVKVLSHIGGTAPTNGSTFRRQAVIDVGGFNETHGISGDLILFYNLASDYAVYQTITPLGFYRWGSNSMMQKDSIYKVIADNFDFREYVYRKNPIVGKIFRSCHYKYFSSFAISERQNVSGEKISLSDFNDVYEKRPNRLWYMFYLGIVCRVYSRHKNHQSKCNEKRALHRVAKLERQRKGEK